MTRLRVIFATVDDWYLWVGQALLAAYRATIGQLDLTDLMVLVGLAGMGVGLFFVFWPAALIVPGALLFLVGVVGSLRQGQEPERDEEGN